MFSYYMPTRILAGENVVRNNASAFALGRKAIIVTGRSSAQKCGALNDVTDALNKIGVSYDVYDKIENNPTVECAYYGGRFAKDHGADFIIGIGGGSPMDASKAIAVYAVNDIEPMQIFDGNFVNKPLPIIAVPTTAGTGSEVTPYSILTLTKEQTKRNFTCEDCFPKIAFLDGRYTVKLPIQVARNTAVDAMCHAIEGYLNNRATAASDYIALETLRLIGECLPALKSGDFSVPICEKLLFAASLGGIVISQAGTTIVHSMGYQLTFFKDIPHGMANGMLIGAFLDWCGDVCGEKIARVVEAIGLSSVCEFKELMKKLLVNESLFTDEEIEAYLKISMNAKLASAPKTVTIDGERDIYRKSLL